VEAKAFARFSERDARVRREPVEVIEARTGRSAGKRGLALLRKAFLKAVKVDAGAGIARRDGAPGAWIAPFQLNFTDRKTNGAAFVFPEELIFPEGGDAIDFKGSAEAPADIIDREAREPAGDGFKCRSRNDGRSIRDGVVGETTFGVANDDLLLEEDAEPFGGVFVLLGKRESARRNFAAVGRNRKRHFAKVVRIDGANVVDQGSALAVDPFAVHRIQRPGAIESQAAGRRNVRLGNGHRVESFDGMKPDESQGG
jgi:hypothetical protein